MPASSNHSAEAAVAAFLRSSSTAPASLIIEGEPGIGKTTLWSAGRQQALDQGFTVLSARASAAEAVLAYTSVADLLGDLDSGVLSSLPGPQLHAIEQVLNREPPDARGTDHRTLGAALLRIVEELSADAPVLLAVDDLQWLDPSSRNLLAFVARRLKGRVGVLATLRTDSVAGFDVSWLELPLPDAAHRTRVDPMSLGRLHELVHHRVGRTPPRPTMVRIHNISGGNPLYALELVRALEGFPAGETDSLPVTLAQLVDERLGKLEADIRTALLACACLAVPTVELVAAATGQSPDELVDTLDDVIGKGIVEIVGNRLRFAHPLLTHGVYTGATPTQRRAMHRRLAELIGEPELHARHLALAATTHDATAVNALDAAAESAAIRGAPAAAAELSDLAVALDGDDYGRRTRSAGYHLNAGDIGRARALLQTVIDESPSGPVKADALRLLAAVTYIDGSALESVNLLQRALREPGVEAAQRAVVLVGLAFALLNAGDANGSLQHIDEAVVLAEELGQPALLSQALSIRVQLGFMRGEGVDQAVLSRALELEDPDADVPPPFRATVVDALLKGWTGRLDEARASMRSIQKDFSERGRESDLAFISYNLALIEIWRCDFDSAGAIADDIVERARHLGDQATLVASSVRVAMLAFTGPADIAKGDFEKALAACQDFDATIMVLWLLSVAAFLEISLGNHQTALDLLAPLIAGLEQAPDVAEIFMAGFVPDAVEAMISSGLLDEAEPWIERLERNGHRLDRPWMLAVGARCRSISLAARGDLKAAEEVARHALVEHRRLPMPFEYARTQLTLGQLQRRRRHQAAASATLREATATFERLGVSIWAQRARDELSRVNFGPRGSNSLTAGEQRVAELAAAGKTNRDVAAELFISQKTVEANLSRAYRKLGVRSRIELVRRLNSGE